MGNYGFPYIRCKQFSVRFITFAIVFTFSFYHFLYRVDWCSTKLTYCEFTNLAVTVINQFVDFFHVLRTNLRAMMTKCLSLETFNQLRYARKTIYEVIWLDIHHKRTVVEVWFITWRWHVRGHLPGNGQNLVIPRRPLEELVIQMVPVLLQQSSPGVIYINIESQKVLWAI